MKKRLILMIHGLSSSYEKCWGVFPKLIQEDKELAEDFDIGYYEYPASLFKIPLIQKSLKIQDLAMGLKTIINNKFAEYDSISLVCHSLGGLIARMYLIQEVKVNKSLKVDNLLLYATPNNGAGLATVGKIISPINNQLKQLCKKSDLTELLNQDWFNLDLEKKVNCIYVGGGLDIIVDLLSVKMFWGNLSFELIPEKGHTNIVKPQNNEDLSFIILKRFLKNQRMNLSHPKKSNRSEKLTKRNKRIHNSEENNIVSKGKLDLEKPISISRLRKQEKLDTVKKIANIAIHPSGKSIAYSQDHKLFVFDMSDVFPKHLGEHQVKNSQIDNYTIKDMSAGTFDSHLPTDTHNTELKDKSESEAHYRNITDLTYSPDGNYIISSDYDGNIKVWSLVQGESVCEISEHTDAVTSLAFSPDGNFFASASFDEFIYIWRFKDVLKNEKAPFQTFEKKSSFVKFPVYQHDIEQIQSIQFSHNGEHLASGDQQGVVVVREISSGEEVFRKKIHNNYIRSICFSPVEKGLLATASDDTRIRLINFYEGGTAKTLGFKKDKHSEPLNSIVFSHNGDLLVSAACDKTVKIWNVKNQKLLYSFLQNDDHIVDKIAFFPNEYNFATDKFYSDISLWEISNSGDIINTKIDVDYD